MFLTSLGFAGLRLVYVSMGWYTPNVRCEVDSVDIYVCVCEESANMCVHANENFQEFNNIPHQPYIM